MPRGREPEGETALSNAERQARYRARRQTEQPPVIVRQPRQPRQSRRKRWDDALAVMMTVQAECAAWFEALPESLRDSATAEALQEIVALDLDSIAAVRPHLVTAVTDHAAIATWVQRGGRAQPWQIVGPRHARSQAVAARGSGPAEDGGFDTARHGRQGDLRSGRRNRRLDRTKEQMRARIVTCRHGHPPITVAHPKVGETAKASHTEIRTLPRRKRLVPHTELRTGSARQHKA